MPTSELTNAFEHHGDIKHSNRTVTHLLLNAKLWVPRISSPYFSQALQCCFQNCKATGATSTASMTGSPCSDPASLDRLQGPFTIAKAPRQMTCCLYFENGDGVPRCKGVYGDRFKLDALSIRVIESIDFGGSF